MLELIIINNKVITIKIRYFYTYHTGKGGLGSTKFVAFETLVWHNECFFCHLCKDSMVGKGFIQVGFIMQNHEE